MHPKTMKRNRQSKLRPCSRRGDHGLTAEDWQTLEREIGPALEASRKKDQEFTAEFRKERERLFKEIENELKWRGKPEESFNLHQWYRERLEKIQDPEIRKLAQENADELFIKMIGQAIEKRRILS